MLWSIKVRCLRSEGRGWSGFWLGHHQSFLVLVNDTSVFRVLCVSILFYSWSIIRFSFWVRMVFVLLLLLRFFSILRSMSRSWSSPISRVVWVGGGSLLPCWAISSLASTRCVLGLITAFVSKVLLYYRIWLYRRRSISLPFSKLDQVHIRGRNEFILFPFWGMLLHLCDNSCCLQRSSLSFRLRLSLLDLKIRKHIFIVSVISFRRVSQNARRKFWRSWFVVWHLCHLSFSFGLSGYSSWRRDVSFRSDSTLWVFFCYHKGAWLDKGRALSSESLPQKFSMGQIWVSWIFNLSFSLPIILWRFIFRFLIWWSRFHSFFIVWLFFWALYRSALPNNYLISSLGCEILGFGWNSGGPYIELIKLFADSHDINRSIG